MNAILTYEGDATGLRFSARVEKVQFFLDSGREAKDPSPIQALLASVGACTGMDVISILKKKRQQVTSYTMELEGDRREEHPRSFTRIRMVHRFRGQNLSLPAIAEAIQLSEDKYCSVIASIRPAVEVSSRFEVEPGGNQA
jgi:putative redox protein